MESPLRSLVKAVTWQVLGLFSMTAVAFVVTGNLTAAGGLALGAALTSFVLFFVHERIWAIIRWGKSESASRTSD